MIHYRRYDTQGKYLNKQSRKCVLFEIGKNGVKSVRLDQRATVIVVGEKCESRDAMIT
jgi:hypothetical protein